MPRDCRLQAKFAKDFDYADQIQNELTERGVFVHDGIKEYRHDGTPYDSFRDLGGARSSRANKQQYTKSPHSGDADGMSDEQLERDYVRADIVREGLRSRYDVIVDDRLRQ